MGTTLCNINLYNPEKKEYDPGEELYVAHIRDGWDTILEEDDERDFDRISKLAATLSKSLNTTAIVTIFFDDDVFGLDVYSDGDVKAFYHSSYGETESEDTQSLVDAMDTDAASAKALHYLLDQDLMACDAVHKFSVLSGLPFYLDKFMFDESDGNYVPDKEQVLKELEIESGENFT